jgi:hypothetical protein
LKLADPNLSIGTNVSSVASFAQGCSYGDRSPLDLDREQFQELGHEVIVANVRELRAILHSDRKSDQVDPEELARYARLDPEVLRPIAHRTVEQQEAFWQPAGRILAGNLFKMSGTLIESQTVLEICNAAFSAHRMLRLSMEGEATSTG